MGAPVTSLAPSTCNDMVKLSDRLFSSWVASKRTPATPATGCGAPEPASGGAVAGGPNLSVTVPNNGCVAMGPAPAGAVVGSVAAGSDAGPSAGLAGGGASFGAPVPSTGLGP